MAYYYSPFRKVYKKENPSDKENICTFCNKKVLEEQAVRDSQGVIIENEHYYWQVNYFPKFEGHTLIVPKEHIISLEQETSAQVLSRYDIKRFAIEILQKLYPGAGVELFLQYGPGAASSIQHLHWHLVPAFEDDKLRSFEKLGHFYTKEKDQEKVLIFPLKINIAKQDLQKALCKLIEKNPFA